MATKMLIDAAHPEETRVVVVRDNKVEEFDFEAASRKQLRGNIYLAKVTRVEPSLQAAFVDYGGNRHGFLAFSEIHPDYYQIPYADRQALIAEESADERSDSEEPEGNGNGEQDAEAEDANGDDDANGSGESSGTVEEITGNGDDSVESVGGSDALEEVPERRSRPRRSYKIQEVIKKRQVLLVQVVKEERGNKGAALTTYLSLAGRYSVLMPNTARGGGISRKITNAADRKRLKAIAADLDVPEGMGVILRTAGAARTKAEVKRDFEYLLRLWENVRELTLKSIAPNLVYEEGSLVKRAIRDLYSKDIDSVLINGEAAYREAKDFMRMLMPSHAKNIQPYRDQEPIYSKYNVEGQLDAMFSPQVTLKSGGYIVLNQTEALVAIDVNSGRSTREHNIEDTALKTNLEAADEVARQLRLRDLAGLIVIDFIDMEEKRNNRAVERRVKEALKHDRARIQVGRISHFGLLEMSRQRIRFGVLESSLEPCAHCEGTGRIRSVESVALHVLRSMEYELLRAKPTDLTVKVRTPVALYMLNQKRDNLRQLEALGITITIEADETLPGTAFKLEKGEPARAPEREAAVHPVSVDPDAVLDEDEIEDQEEEAEAAGGNGSRGSDEDRQGRRGRRRRRRRRGGDGQAGAPDEVSEVAAAEESESASEREADEEPKVQEDDAGEQGEEAGASSRRRRRGRRGGRRHRRDADQPTVTAEAAAEATGGNEAEARTVEAQPETPPEPVEEPAPEPASTEVGETAQPAVAEAAEPSAPEAEEAPKKRRAPRKTPAKPRTRKPKPEAVSEAPEAAPQEESAESERVAPEPEEVAAAPQEDAPRQAPEPVAEEPAREPAAEQQDSGPPRRGWWQRRGLFGG